nr:neuritin isoform X1 [Oryctolagus cuniculus]
MAREARACNSRPVRRLLASQPGREPKETPPLQRTGIFAQAHTQTCAVCRGCSKDNVTGEPPAPGQPQLPLEEKKNCPCISGTSFSPASFGGGAYLVQAVRAAGKCDAVFKGFSDCLLKLGDSMANYPQGLDDKTNIKTVCTYWEDFHSCTVTALTDCQEGAKDMWDKLRKESKNLNIQGSLFELCGSGNGAAGPLLPALPVLLVSLWAALVTWLPF